MSLGKRIVRAYTIIMIIVGLAIGLSTLVISMMQIGYVQRKWRQDSQANVVREIASEVQNLRKVNLLVKSEFGNKKFLGAVDDTLIDLTKLPQIGEVGPAAPGAIQPAAVAGFIETASNYLDAVEWIDVIGVCTPSGSNLAIDKSARDRSNDGMSLFQHVSWSTKGTKARAQFGTLLSRSNKRDSELEFFETTEIDATKLPVYVAAATAGRETWTGVYKFIDYDDTTVAFAQPVVLAEGGPPWVFYYCVSQTRLSNQLSKIKRNGSTIILFDGNGEKVASSEPAGSSTTTAADNVGSHTQSGRKPGEIRHEFLLSRVQDGMPPWTVVVTATLDEPFQLSRIVLWLVAIWGVAFAIGFAFILLLANRLSESDTFKSRVIAAIQHEKISPLLPVSDFLGNILDLSYSFPADSWERAYASDFLERARAARDAVFHVQAVATNLLVFVRREQGKSVPSLTTSCCDLNQLVSRTASLVGSRVQQGVHLQVFTPSATVLIDTDPCWVRHILYNLLSNAAKFTSNGHIDVEVKVSDAAKESVEIECTVKDTGCGIPETQRAKVFDFFSQAKPSERGYGIGLAISQLLAENLGGRIEYKENTPKGSKFVWTFQSRLSRDPLPGNELRDHIGSELIAIVDDDSFALETIRDSLCRHGYKVHCYKHWEQLLESMQRTENIPRVVVLDNQYPGELQSGIVGAKRIKEYVANPSDILVILLSGGLLSPNERNGNPYIDRVILKSVDYSDLLEEVRYLLNSSDEGIVRSKLTGESPSKVVSC